MSEYTNAAPKTKIVEFCNLLKLKNEDCEAIQLHERLYFTMPLSLDGFLLPFTHVCGPVSMSSVTQTMRLNTSYLKLL